MNMRLVFIVMIFFTSHIDICLSQSSIYDICRNGSAEELEHLYSNDKSIINQRNDDGYLPITLAAYHNNYEVVNFLIDKVDNINANSKKGSPLMAAVFKKDLPISKLLLEHDANPNIQDENGSTAMHFATLFKYYDIIKLLLEANADFTIKDNMGKSALDFAKAYNDEEINTILNLK